MEEIPIKKVDPDVTTPEGAMDYLCTRLVLTDRTKAVSLINTAAENINERIWRTIIPLYGVDSMQAALFLAYISRQEDDNPKRVPDTLLAKRYYRSTLCPTRREIDAVEDLNAVIAGVVRREVITGYRIARVNPIAFIAIHSETVDRDVNFGKSIIPTVLFNDSVSSKAFAIFLAKQRPEEVFSNVPVQVRESFLRTFEDQNKIKVLRDINAPVWAIISSFAPLIPEIQTAWDAFYGEYANWLFRPDTADLTLPARNLKYLAETAIASALATVLFAMVAEDAVRDQPTLENKAASAARTIIVPIVRMLSDDSRVVFSRISRGIFDDFASPGAGGMIVPSTPNTGTDDGSSESFINDFGGSIGKVKITVRGSCIGLKLLSGKEISFGMKKELFRKLQRIRPGLRLVDLTEQSMLGERVAARARIEEHERVSNTIMSGTGGSVITGKSRPARLVVMASRLHSVQLVNSRTSVDDIERMVSKILAVFKTAIEP